MFARTTPEQKLSIIRAWRATGAVVAMTGDGVNDGPALSESDIGVAMGHHGTEVARQASDLVLADDDIGTIVHAVEEGRRVYANIRRFLVFGLAGGAAEVMVMLLGPLVGLALPLLAAQILWINLLTHGLTGVAMGAEPSDPGMMDRAPRPSSEQVLGDRLWLRVLVLATGVAAVSLGIGLWAERSGRPWQSLLFMSLASLQLGVALGLRSRMITRANPALPLVVAGSVGLLLAAVYLAPLRDLLGTAAPGLSDTAVALGAGALGWVGTRLTNLLLPSRPDPGQTALPLFI